jgi:tRNA G37 N-methylase Trm5
LTNISCVNETIVDLTLPFLVHDHARHVYACEWNPDSMEALRRYPQANHIDDDRYTLLLGDNQSVYSCPFVCRFFIIIFFRHVLLV